MPYFWDILDANFFGGVGPFINFGFEDIPHIFNGVKIWGIGWPGNDRDFRGFKEDFDGPASMARCIVLHECRTKPLSISERRYGIKMSCSTLRY